MQPERNLVGGLLVAFQAVGPRALRARRGGTVPHRVVTTGYLGLAAYLFTTGAALLLAVRLARHGPYAGLAAALGGTLVAHLVEAPFGLVLAVTNLHCWFLVALLLALAKVRGPRSQVRGLAPALSPAEGFNVGLPEPVLGPSPRPTPGLSKARPWTLDLGLWTSLLYVVLVMGGAGASHRHRTPC
ncbi:MAG: hypothetical protein HY332_08890 [Chloroflexi bacterium]|nr:hypothetical protein [Chloroflexota bacterium]